ncbi:acyl-CoA dehydrogenase family protein [Amycolatopsis keratiniphila]|uniref:Acyl-CoA dehydrogenase n=1 Tax=Amycolatopsis keratiniphila subsp. keratiniphila TaxID=227715 RepID=A0A1W2LSL6_9PSEU|nr:acyl-CoA dehydrogenase family protein [Amycolatopsis keratiniphila]ONF67866.1 hypothetical protein AVR91_0220685 [Amycolatopsis keratiniphila subsp. keratiniphila]
MSETAPHETDLVTGVRHWARENNLLDTAAWRSGAECGLLSSPLPVTSGGTGAGFEMTCLALEAIADESGVGGLPFAFSAHLWAFQSPLAEFGTESQHATYLMGSLRGEVVGAFAATEPDAGSDLLSLRTKAEPDGSEHWRLTGRKTFVTNGPTADVFLVLARTGEGSALGALTAFLVPRATAGLVIGEEIPKAALAGARFNGLRLDDCVVSDRARLGEVGSGFAVLMHAMRYERAFILAPVLGLMARAQRRAVEYVNSRVQFGQAIGAYDAIRERLVRMYLNLTCAREILLGSARLADEGRLDHGRASLTKLSVSNEFTSFSRELPDLYGGYALLPETGAIQLMADALASRYYSGTSEMQIKVIAEGLGL